MLIFLPANDPPPSVNSTLIAPFAQGSHHFNYYALDGVVGQKILCDCCVAIDLFAGLHYAHFFTKDHDFFGEEIVIVDEKSNFSGI